MDNINWEEIAKYVLENENILKSRNYPVSISVLVKWKNSIYIGSVQYISQEFSMEIVLLSKSTSRLPDDLVNEIRKLDKKRLELNADDSLDLIGRQHIIRILGNNLVRLTSEQTEYMTKHPPRVLEI